ncbi:MBL fold metallo-hydrolase [Oricola sp.]|uniref:MBL fold metallo-hydrolase n=1 Tax=Oricola sp. TaxID=1979950 RepID=UPI003BA9F9B2
MRFVQFLRVAFIAVAVPAGATAQPANEPPVSQCLAVAQALPGVIFVSTADTPLAVTGEVAITFAGHSTYRIETPAGVTIATDFSGVYGANPIPRVITMNRAHSTHYTLSPDSRIEHVLPGWNPDGPEPAEHRTVVDDVYIRNVTTDIRSWEGGMVPEDNSIFIFEVAGLCIGHLGHLHHALTDAHYAEIGRLDILMVPVDGGLTLSHAGMAEITGRLRSSVVLPMHLRGNSITSFISMMGPDFAVEFLDTSTVTIGIRDLPKRPTIMVPAGLATRG